MQSPATQSPETPMSSAVEFQADFIQHLQDRLHVSPREARELLAAWLQDLAPIAITSPLSRARAQAAE